LISESAGFSIFCSGVDFLAMQRLDHLCSKWRKLMTPEERELLMLVASMIAERDADEAHKIGTTSNGADRAFQLIQLIRRLT
jgi:hypothetical protein